MSDSKKSGKKNDLVKVNEKPREKETAKKSPAKATTKKPKIDESKITSVKIDPRTGTIKQTKTAKPKVEPKAEPKVELKKEEPKKSDEVLLLEEIRDLLKKKTK